MEKTKQSITITADYESLVAAIKSGVTTPELLAEWLDGAELIEDALVIESGYHADDGNGDVHYDDADDGDEAAQRYVDGGEWGDDGGSVNVRTWRNGIDADGDDVCVDEEFHDVDIAVNHDALISAAGGDTDCDHDWTSEGEGGCTENPGVWSNGGTALTISDHCRKCGLHRTNHHAGCQRNPGEAMDSYTYTQPEAWCAECESEECSCDNKPEYGQ